MVNSEEIMFKELEKSIYRNFKIKLTSREKIILSFAQGFILRSDELRRLNEDK